MKKFLSLLLSLILCFSLTATAFGVSGGEIEKIEVVSPAVKTVYNILDTAVNAIIKAIAYTVPTPKKWNEEKSSAFMSGTQSFITAPKDGAVWSLGYDSRSILLPEEEIIGKMYVAGSIGLENKYATEIIDDLKVRTVALNDGSQRGTAVICVVDSYGLALTDVREIRERLSSFCEEKNINSVTISVLHQHSAVDTFGMNGNIWDMVFLNGARDLFGKAQQNGKNEKYMENLFEKCISSIKAATENLTEGKLYSGTADASKYTADKRAPYVMDPNFNRLRFVPANGSKETWLVSSPVHCVGNGAAGTAITGDYPYYAEKEIGESANVLFYLGAEQSTSQQRNADTVYGYKEGMTRIEEMQGFGKSIGIDLKAIADETEVAPIFNVRYKEIALDIDNPILLLAGKVGMFDNLIKKTDGEYKVISELGYMEIGNDIAFAVIPGEIAPELIYGGTLEGDYAWHSGKWQYPAFEEMLIEKGINRNLQVIGLANDQIGYIVPSNNYIPMLHESSQSIELVSLGRNTAVTIAEDFSELLEDRA